MQARGQIALCAQVAPHGVAESDIDPLHVSVTEGLTRHEVGFRGIHGHGVLGSGHHKATQGRRQQDEKQADEQAGVPHLNEALGYVLEATLPPGRSDGFIRIETPDPMVLAVRLPSPRAAGDLAQVERYSYGFLYGFLFSLATYNLMLFLGMRRWPSLYYAVYLLSFIALNLCYTGRGLVWLWPDSPYLQLGECKYGRPILDRGIDTDTSLDPRLLAPDDPRRSSWEQPMPGFRAGPATGDAVGVNVNTAAETWLAWMAERGHRFDDVWSAYGVADQPEPCLLYTSDAADERSSVDLGGRRIIKKKTPRYIT